jgi:hypothetical protein
MRQRILLGILVVLVAVSWWLKAENAARIAAPTTRRARPGHGERDAAVSISLGGADTRITRNPFEYGGGAAPREPRPGRTPRPASEALAEVEPAPPLRVRLVGVVRPSSGPVKAALSVDGEVVLLAPGGAAEGYTVLEILDDQSVRVRIPSGEDVTLTASR